MKDVVFSIFTAGGLASFKLDAVSMATLLNYSEPFLAIDLEEATAECCSFSTSETLTPLVYESVDFESAFNTLARLGK